MSELIQKNDNRATIRWKLLTGASALALTAYVSSAVMARAEDSDRPQVWIELGGSLSRLQDSQEVFAPPFVALTPPDFSPPQNAERAPLYGIDESGKISFRPDNSDWTFSASVRYGRVGSDTHTHQQNDPAYSTAYLKVHRTFYGVSHHFTHVYHVKPDAARFADAMHKQSESHAILDFQAGKDLGLGLFGRDASSSLSVGVRIAQFTSKSHTTLKENPDWHVQLQTYTASFQGSYYSTQIIEQSVFEPYHSFAGSSRAVRRFTGLGPSLSWNSSVPFAGNLQEGGLSLDWGVNAALLFGRQKAKVHHQTTAVYHDDISKYHAQIPGVRVPDYNHPGTPDHTRSRNVTVPNVGGFMGLSYNYADAKLSLGYRADFFFGAIDGGIDAAKKENRGFYGPYASISIGLGD